MTKNITSIANNNQVQTLDAALDAIWGALERTAAVSLTWSGDLEQFSKPEQRAMLLAEMLGQSKGIDLASVMVKGRIVKELDINGLYAAHPNGYKTMEQLAVDRGISVSELSQVRDLTEVIFPWIQAQLRREIPEVWDSIGKSNMRELVPVLKRLITGEEARGSVETSAQRVLDDVAASVLARGDTVTEGELAVEAVQVLLEAGQGLTNANLRQTLRPERMPSINATIIKGEGQSTLVAILDPDQEQLVARKLHGYFDPIYFSSSDTVQSINDLESIIKQYPAIYALVKPLIGE